MKEKEKERKKNQSLDLMFIAVFLFDKSFFFKFDSK